MTSCRPTARNIQTYSVVNPAYTILCGAQFGQSEACPGTMRCGDVVDSATQMPGTDGQPDCSVE